MFHVGVELGPTAVITDSHAQIIKTITAPSVP